MSHHSTRSTSHQDTADQVNLPDQTPPLSKTKRVATVYDAVAGRIGMNGFMTQEQLESDNYFPSKPEEVLMRRVNAPTQISHEYYNADEGLGQDHPLPDSDLLKAIHSYTSDFYASVTEDKGLIDFKSFDETALIALGILLEEASKEVLGKSGDMVLVEPEGLEHGMPPSKMTKHQVIGKVRPIDVKKYNPEVEGGEEESDNVHDVESPRKKRR